MDQATLSLFGGTANKAADLSGSASKLTSATHDQTAGGEGFRELREQFRALLAEHFPEVAKAGGKDGKGGKDLPLDLLLAPDAQAGADDILAALNALLPSFPPEPGLAGGNGLEVPRDPNALLRNLRMSADQRIAGAGGDQSFLIMNRLASLDAGGDGLDPRMQALAATLDQIGQTDSRVGAELHAIDRGGVGGRADNPQQLAAMLSLTAPTGERAPLSQLPAIQSALGSSNWNEAISQRIIMMVGRGIERAEVRIHPPNLGPLEIRIATTQEQTSLVLASQNAETRDALEQAMPRLREMLEENDVELADIDVRDPSTGAEDETPPQDGSEADAAGAGDRMPGSPGQWRATDVRILDQYI